MISHEIFTAMNTKFGLIAVFFLADGATDAHGDFLFISRG